MILGYINNSYGSLSGKIAASTSDNKTYLLNFHDLVEQDSSVYTVYVRKAECGHNLEINLTVLETDMTEGEFLFLTLFESLINQANTAFIYWHMYEWLNALLITYYMIPLRLNHSTLSLKK